MKNGRGRLDIWADAIDAAKIDGSYEHLYIKAGKGMSARRFHEYIFFLVNEGFLTMVPSNNELYRPTQKGLGFSTEYKEHIKPLLEKN